MTDETRIALLESENRTIRGEIEVLKKGMEETKKLYQDIRDRIIEIKAFMIVGGALAGFVMPFVQKWIFGK